MRAAEAAGRTSRPRSENGRRDGLSGTKNGALLRQAALEFDVLLTVDQGISYQQNLAGLDLALIIMTATSNDINDLRPMMPEVLRVLATIRPGQVVTVGTATLSA